MITDQKNKVGEIVFETEDSKLIISHIEVQKSLRKEGLGEKLILTVVEKAKRNHMTIEATLPYAMNYIKHHKKELEDVV